MYVYGVTITGEHETLGFRRYYGAAPNATVAMRLARRAAQSAGFEAIRVDELSALGTLSFVHLENCEEGAS